MGNAVFRPVRGTESSISSIPITDGWVYYALDSGKIYIDKDNQRIGMGGSGAAIYYGKGNNLSSNEEDGTIYFPVESLEDPTIVPKIDDIILNHDGAFYRIIDVNNDVLDCNLLSVSGTGEGGGTGSRYTRPSIEGLDEFNTTIINGQDALVYFVATSDVDSNDKIVDKNLTVYWELSVENSGAKETYAKGSKAVISGEQDFIDITSVLRESSTSTLTIQVSGLNHDLKKTVSIKIITSNLILQQSTDFSNANTYNTGNITLRCNVVGSIDKVLDIYFDGELFETRWIASSDKQSQSFTVPNVKHGYHTVKIELYQSLGSSTSIKRGSATTPLNYEIAVIKPNDSTQPPVIWLGEYQDTYYNYDTIQIPFLVYDPADTTKVKVHLYKNDIEIDGSPRTITDFSNFNYWEIPDADLDKQNYYQISCGESEDRKVTREISFIVQQDPNRDMTITNQDNLILNFDPAGRSNSESSTRRATWTYGNDIQASFENFNWYNNGWYTDTETNQTCLRISNGAKFSIPIGPLTFAGSNSSTQSNSIELEFKIRNIQNYANLITNITRYNDDDKYYDEFLNQTTYTNYDAFLQNRLKEDYDNLVFKQVQKNINLKNIVCGYYSGDQNGVVGLGVGPQDVFFSNGPNTVNVSFVEDEIINLSLVYSHSLKLLLIYINGCITGVIKSTVSNNFSITANDIVFNSQYCDIDLYKLRVYNTDLSVNDIVINYAVDKKDVKIYDQNRLAELNSALKEYQLNYANVIEYNDEHPNEPLMPYIILDTTVSNNNNKLPYRKDEGSNNIKMTFVNTPLEKMYANGELESLARADGLIADGETDNEKIKEGIKQYYKHHCPSFTSSMSTSDTVTIQVQGTSSEFYPRRNFKVKTKYKKDNTWDETENNGEGGWTESSCLNIFMNRGPYADVYAEDQEKLQEDAHYYGLEESRLADGWYLNNYTNPTDRWTLKIDYMESSGSYNAGFASMAGTAYTKHPLQDYYNASGILNNKNKLNSDRWEDYRTSLFGFPVMVFQRIDTKNDPSTDYVFIGYYRMLLDKSSTEVLGFKTDKKITTNAVLDGEGSPKKLRDVAECWEFSTNQRTFCSFRDPWNRVQLSFKAPVGESNEFTAKYAPVVTDHFEYRYSFADDFMDGDDYDGGLYNFSGMTQSGLDNLVADINDETGWGIESLSTMSSTTAGSVTEEDKQKARAAGDVTLRFYENWEKVCQWLWSTCLENVTAQGTYELVPVGNEIYKPNTYYIIDENQDNQFVIATDEEFDKNQTYYTKDTKNDDAYVKAFVTSEEYKYKKNKFYQLVSGTYSLISNEDENFDSSLTYYELINYSDEELAQKADLLVEKATGDFNDSNDYYTYNGSAKIKPGSYTGAVTKVENPVLSEFEQGLYYVAAPKTYAEITYKYDTQEYRAAKFINEFSNHFDPEYVATYFIMTEVFECYDSRGKNCMMASWGPKEVGGDYIWYPIFYDIDTQLGINNTGIPSFEYNVDVTEDYNFSTSDSILWNNYYKFFKNSYILTKYQNLRGSDQAIWKKLDNPPLVDVDTIEGWYSFDPDVTNNIAAKGDRPLIATNLDMYFKYITICNENAIKQNVGYLDSQGQQTIDRDGTYFYALQGDRSQSRRQFVTNRLEYIDSWLGQKNYARGGSNRIRGRISANATNDESISDIWIESAENPYWKDGVEYGTKSHELDAEYWLNLTPIRSTYVTAGEDNANYPSQKYDGVNPVRFELSQLENAIRTSPNYAEQLVYIYGLNQMADCGDLSRLYFREFYLEGKAPHLTSLRLGDDAHYIDDDGNEYDWYNMALNGITLPELPLLKEANFSKISLSTETTLDLKASEKLEDFRAVGTSRLQNVIFAPGVALNTLYLPTSVTELSLTQANLLNKVIEKAEAPRPQEDGSVEKGLFIEGLFSDKYNSGLTKINLEGGSLGYGSYSILDVFYKNRKDNTMNSNITMTDVNWTPFTQLVEGDVYDEQFEYYQDDGHYGFKNYSYNNETEFNNLVLNGKLYVKNKAEEKEINYDFVTMLEDLANKSNFVDASGSTNPVISGVVYINNADKTIEESYIRNTLQTKYPDLTFFFANVEKAYSIEFLMESNDTGVYEYVPYKDGSNLPATQKISQADYIADNSIWFENPFELYNPIKTHYDFKGWSLNPNPTSNDEIISASEVWEKLNINADQYDYAYYAIFTIHQYTITFYDGNGVDKVGTIKKDYGYSSGLEAPDIIPYLDDSELDLTMTYSFVGYTDNTLTNKIVDLSKVIVRNNINYYPVFEEKSVYDNINENYFSCIGGELSLIKKVSGKITIPVQVDGIKVTRLNSTFNSSNNGPYLTHVFFANGTSVTRFNDNCFSDESMVGKLAYVEFPASLVEIGSKCFYRCQYLKYSNVNGKAIASSSNVTSIGSGAFQQAFSQMDEPINIYVGSKLNTITGTGAVFYNTGNGKYGIDTVYIGEQNNKSVLNFTQTFVQIGYEQKDYKVILYSSVYTSPDGLDQYFTGSPQFSVI